MRVNAADTAWFEADLTLCTHARVAAVMLPKAERMADGSTLVSAGYGAFMARFDRRGNLTSTFGGVNLMPEEVSPFFYATFQVLDDGRVMVANWQGHGPGNGHKGRQLLEFSAGGKLLDSWSDPHKISSLQGILIL